MKFVLQPWQLMLIILASWINRQQQKVIEYLRTENAVLKEKFGEKRLLLTDDQRRRLAVKGRLIGRKQLEQAGTLFTPDTVLRWDRQLVANKWDYCGRKEKRPGRSRIRQVIVDLTVKFAKENPTWGYDRISGALSNIGYRTSATTSVTPPLVTSSNRTVSNQHRTSTDTASHRILGNIPQGALGRDGFDRFHDRRSLDKEWADDVVSFVRHGAEYPQRPLRRLYHQSA